MKVQLRWVSCLALGVLAACTGGGGGGGGTTAPSTATPVPTASRTATSIPSSTATPIAAATATAVPTSSPTVPPTVPFTPTFTRTPTTPPAPTQTPAPSASFTPTNLPTSTASPLPTSIPTQTPLTGPIVSAFGIADGSGNFNAPVDTDPQGRPIFGRQASAGFIIYVEGRPGPGRLPVGTDRLTSRPGDPTRQPDLQIESSANLGNGSPAVCDNSYPNVGGVPAISPTDFSPVQAVSDALNDWSCRFKVYAETDFACTQDSSGNFLFGSAASTVQFCTLVSEVMSFPTGDTVLTARLLDTAGNAGPAAQIVVRVSAGS